MRSESQRKADKKWQQSEADKAARRCYLQSNKGKNALKRYQQSEKGKIAQARVKAKRKELGFEMINNWFPGSHGHHIDKENVLFIPEELHNLISHSQDNSESMQRMNDAAFEWFYIEEVI